MRDYLKKVQLANKDLKKYWENKFKRYTWFKEYTEVLDNSDPNFPKWFPGGEMNFTYECLDKHLDNGHGDDVAFIFESYYTKKSNKITYKELLTKVAAMAGSFAEKRIKKKDRILMFLPSVCETVVCMLAAARLGAVYTVLYGGFSGEAIADRIDDFHPKIIVTANNDFALGHSTPMKELMDNAIEIAKHKPDYCFIWQRPDFKSSSMVSGRDFDLKSAIDNGTPHAYTPVEVNEPFYVVYTSGTTGKPKGIVHCTRGMATATIQDDGFLVNPSIRTQDPVAWINSSFAWVAGQFATCYMALIWKVSSIVYEGAIKDVEPEEVYRVISVNKVTTTMIPTQGIRRMMAVDPHGNRAKAFKPFDLQFISCGGVAVDIPTLTWAQKTFEVPITSVYGQTEIGGIASTIDHDKGELINSLLSVGKPVPGINLKIMKEDGKEAQPGEAGKVMIKMPLYPGMMVTILNNDQLFVKELLSTCEGFYDSKDEGKIDENGFLYVLCRSDSVFKVGGDRISCTEIEEVMMSHPDIAECIVVTKFVAKFGASDLIPEGFFITKSGTKSSSAQIAKDLVTLVHSQIGNFVPFNPPHQVDEFPKTVSGKISRSIVEQAVRNPTKLSEYINTDPSVRSVCEALKKINPKV